MASPIPLKKRLRVLQLAAVIFFTVSCGPYGLELLLGYAGSHGASLLLMITPLLWDVDFAFRHFCYCFVRCRSF